MLAISGEDFRFNFDKIAFGEYGSALSKLLLARLSAGLSVELTNKTSITLSNQSVVTLPKYTLDIMLNQKDIRELNFIAQGYLPEEGEFFDKLLTLIVQQIHNEQELLASESIIPKDLQVIVFGPSEEGELMPIRATSTPEGELRISTTFKVIPK